MFLCSPEVERISTPCFLSTLALSTALGFRNSGKFHVLSSSLDSVESLSECCILWTTGLGAIGIREEVEVSFFLNRHARRIFAGGFAIWSGRVFLLVWDTEGDTVGPGGVSSSFFPLFMRVFPDSEWLALCLLSDSLQRVLNS